MALVKISRGADIQHNYVNGVSRVSILEGAYKDATVERISLQPGADFSAELYTREQHNQVFLITAGKGYIVTPRRVFNITEVSVFVPDFDKESVTFHCAADAKETMEIVHFVTELNDYDKTCLKEAHMSLPRFRGVSGAWHYKEDFTGADIQHSRIQTCLGPGVVRQIAAGFLISLRRRRPRHTLQVQFLERDQVMAIHQFAADAILPALPTISHTGM